jgi:hypothetical protein
MPVLLLGLLAPIALMVVAVVMEGLERRVGVDPLTEQLDLFLATAQPDEVETFVSEGYSAALDKYWRNRGRG